MAEAKTNEVDFLDLPDDELPDYPPDEISGDSESEAENAAEEVNLTEEDEENDDTTDEGLSNETGSSGESQEEIDSEGAEDSESDTENGGDAESGPETSEEGQDHTEEENVASAASDEASGQSKPDPGKSGEGTNTEVTENEVSLGAEAQLQQLFAPFKANGRDMQVGSVNDALTLMKMGANYNKKMQGLKPNLRLMKMLDNNKLLDEEKLSYLIDLQNKNPQAIAKLLKDSGVDPIELEEDNTDYTPGTYTVNETEVDLDMVLDEIKDTPSFQKTIDAISNKWDTASRKLAQDDPKIIKTINAHMENGTYEPIMDIVQNEKALGRLTEMSDLQAYKHVGDTLQAQGAFNQQPPANEQQPNVKRQQDPKLKNRKKAAANTRSAPAKGKVEFDPLALGDEEFEKMAATLNI